ncbi:hypothetical protein C9418_12740 [Rhizobium sp. SEMIA 4032]|nr:hypothetical protein C9418_12740 [Rhizobium sp. SEMIA 4032]
MAFQEINLALRMNAMAMASFDQARQMDSYELTTVAHSNMAMLDRSLMAKVSEYRELINDFLKIPDPKEESEKIAAFRAAAREAIKVWGQDKTFGLMKWYRNNASAHYGFDEKGIGALTRNIGAPDDERIFEILFHEKLGNTHYTMVEQLLSEKLTEHGREALDQVRVNFEAIKRIAFRVMDLHHLFVVAVIELIVVDPAEIVEVVIPHRLLWKTGTKVPILMSID